MCIYLSISLSLYIYIYIHTMYVYTYIYIYIYTHIHTTNNNIASQQTIRQADDADGLDLAVKILDASAANHYMYVCIYIYICMYY